MHQRSQRRIHIKIAQVNVKYDECRRVVFQRTEHKSCEQRIAFEPNPGLDLLNDKTVHRRSANAKCKVRVELNVAHAEH